MILFIGMYFVPETPRWLVSRSREDDARDLLVRSRSEEEIENEIREMKVVECQGKGGLGRLTASW